MMSVCRHVDVSNFSVSYKKSARFVAATFSTAAAAAFSPAATAAFFPAAAAAAATKELTDVQEVRHLLLIDLLQRRSHLWFL